MCKRGFRRFHKKVLAGKSRGATLVEAVIAIIVLGFIVMSIPPVMVLAIESQSRQNELRIGQSLTSSQFEFIKAQGYKWGNEPGNEYVRYDRVVPPLEGYDMSVWARPIDPDTHEYLPGGQDEGVQEIKVIVYSYRYAPPCDPSLDPTCNLEGEDVREILTSTDYKVERSLEISGYEINPPEEG